MARRTLRSNVYVGVDIGSAAIKTVELGRNGGGPVVQGVGAIPTPDGAVREGRIEDPQAVGRALRTLLSERGIRARQAVASVSGQVAIVREVRMPAMPVEEIRQAARFEVERYLPYPIAEVTYDTFVTEEARDNGTTQMDVLIVAARTDVLKRHVEALRVAGLEPVIIDVEPFALARAMAGGDQAVMYVHVGAESTGIVIVSGGTPRVIRTVAFGGNTITRLLAERLGMEFERAEVLKLEMGPAEARGGARPEAIQFQEVVMAGLADLTTEVRRSLDYHGGRFRGSVPERVIVTGGTALLPGLTRYLSTDLDIPVEVGNPWAGLSGISAAQMGQGATPSAPALAVAVGLARRGVEEP